MTDQEMSQGEIQRSLARIEKSVDDLTKEVRDRHHTLSNYVNDRIVPVSAHTIQIENQQKAIDRLDKQVSDATMKATWISGAGAALAFVGSVIVRWFKG